MGIFLLQFDSPRFQRSMSYRIFAARSGGILRFCGRNHRVSPFLLEIDGVGCETGPPKGLLLMDGDLHLAAIGADIGPVDMVGQERIDGIEPATLDAAAE